MKWFVIPPSHREVALEMLNEDMWVEGENGFDSASVRAAACNGGSVMHDYTDLFNARGDLEYPGDDWRDAAERREPLCSAPAK